MKEIDQANREGLPYEKWLAKNVRAVVQLLAGGAEIDRESEYVITRHGWCAGPILSHLIHHGWLTSTANGGTFNLSDAGLKAYLRSTDEMGDGKLVDPRGFEP